MGVVAGDTQSAMKKKKEDVSWGWDELLDSERIYRGTDDQAGAVVGRGLLGRGVLEREVY